MHRTTIRMTERVFRDAKLRALRENVTVSEVLRNLLGRWVAGEIQLSPDTEPHERRVALARAAPGMWSDRDSDAYLNASRQGLQERDDELARAHLDA